jgi:large subunit ribosomal protein L18
MSLERKNKERRKRRILRVKKRVMDNTVLPRVSVFRSLKHFYAQIIDDNKQKTIVSCSSFVLKDLAGDKKKRARALGLALAEKAKEQNVKAVVFDRGRYRYHGRVKEFAEGLREGGIKI